MVFFSTFVLVPRAALNGALHPYPIFPPADTDDGTAHAFQLINACRCPCQEGNEKILIVMLFDIVLYIIFTLFYYYFFQNYHIDVFDIIWCCLIYSIFWDSAHIFLLIWQVLEKEVPNFFDSANARLPAPAPLRNLNFHCSAMIANMVMCVYIDIMIQDIFDLWWMRQGRSPWLFCRWLWTYIFVCKQSPFSKKTKPFSLVAAWAKPTPVDLCGSLLLRLRRWLPAFLLQMQRMLNASHEFMCGRNPILEAQRDRITDGMTARRHPQIALKWSAIPQDFFVFCNYFCVRQGGRIALSGCGDGLLFSTSTTMQQILQLSCLAGVWFLFHRQN